MDYFIITKEGDRFGPVDLNTLNSWLKKGKLNATSMVECGEAGTRIPLSYLPGIEIPHKGRRFGLFGPRKR